MSALSEITGRRPGTPRSLAGRCGAAALFFGLGVLVVLLGAAGSYSDAPWRLPSSSLWFLLPLTLACLGALFGQRRPVLAVASAGLALAVDSVFGGSVGVVIAVTDTLYVGYAGLGPRGRRRLETVLVTVVAVGGLTLTLFAGDLRVALMTTLTGAAVLLVPVWWSRDVQRSALFAELEAERARSAAERAVREERAAMARDLHDVVAGHLSAIALQSEAALSLARTGRTGRTSRSDHDGSGEQTLEVLASIRSASVESLTEMRTMIHLMRDGTPGASRDPAVTAPGLEAVQASVESARRAGLDVALTSQDVEEGTVAPVTGQAVHRILQEALTNARKHAGPGRVEVVLLRAGRDVQLEVTSPAAGTGSAPAPGSGHGLLTMAERAQALGGTLDAGPDATGRWCVRARVPAVGPALVTS
ncbi:MAG: histidine kinase [Pseudonocardia sediminis]